MGVIKPSDDRIDNGLYHSPASSPIKIYSYEKNFGEISSLYDYAYRVYVYYYDDYTEKRPTTVYSDWMETYKQIDIPNSKSGSYVECFSDANFNKDGFIETTLYPGLYAIEYVLYTVRFDRNDNPISQNISSTYYTIAIVENRYPLKKWTITDVVNRCLELIEPLQIGQNPRFALDGVTYVNGVVQKPYRVGSQADFASF